MAEIGLNLYDMNQQIMSSQKPMSAEMIHNSIAGIAMWFSYEIDKYFMLLCHEERDYTLMRFKGNKHCYEGSQKLKEALENRGEILAIDYEDRAYAIWIKKEDGAFLYYLFPYDTGVIEV